MAWRLDKSVVRGEIDNRQRDRVVGQLWLLGADSPVHIALSGNCLRDIAGCRITFENPSPQSGDHIGLSPIQDGICGDITASRKARVIDVTPEEAARLMDVGEEVPEHIGNCLHVEWFSESNGRVIVESANYRITVSPPEWVMSKEEAQQQAMANQEALHQWMNRLSDSVEMTEGDPPPYEDYRPMDEFEWEKFLKASDKLTDKYSQVLEKYMDHPDRDRMVAREMGWTWLEEALDAEDRGEFDPEEIDMSDAPPLEPNPITEGVDWVRTEHGRVTHPLTESAHQAAMDMWHYCENMGLIGDEGDKDLREMVFQAQTLGAKLAGALDGLAYDRETEGGFVVAYLKRAMTYLNESIAASRRVSEKGLMEEQKIAEFTNRLFEVREDMLALMKRFRQQF